MPRRAGRRERAGHREQRHALAARNIRCWWSAAVRRHRRWREARRAGDRQLGWSSDGLRRERMKRQIGSAYGGLKPCSPRRSRPIVVSWLINRVSCPASCCSQCREWPIPVSSARSSRCASMTKMARSALASGTSAPGSRFRGLLRQLEIEPGEAPDCAVHHGGPVEPGRGFVLHSTDWGGQDTLQVNGDNGQIFAMTGTIDVLRAIAGGPRARAMDRRARLCRLGRRTARRGNDAARLVRGARRIRKSCSTRRPTSDGARRSRRKGSTRACWQARPAPPRFQHIKISLYLPFGAAASNGCADPALKTRISNNRRIKRGDPG